VTDRERTVSELETLAEEDVDHPAVGFSLLVYYRDGSSLVPLAPGASLVVGRARPADIAIRDRSLSRQHARFELTDGVVWVEDLGSTNGTSVNGKRVGRVRLAPSDRVSLGSVLVALHAPDDPDETPQSHGLDSHDSFLTRLEQQLGNSRTFGRPLTVMMVQAARRKGGHVSGWSPRLRRHVRAADAIALYGPCEVIIFLAETGQRDALAQAEQLESSRPRSEPQLLYGLASYPRDGSSADELIEAARGALRQASHKKPIQLADPTHAPRKNKSEKTPIVVSRKSQEVYETARRVAQAEIPVLIQGETGTGKEVLARFIHHNSPRRSKPLCCLNCGGIPGTLVESALFGHERGAFTGAERQAKGLFEEADGGTVLLDEIGELSAAAQAALLRVIETKRVTRVGSAVDFAVDVRIIAATHRDLEAMCDAGSFRWDLYYRLNAVSLRLPPLRERREDILPLADQFIAAAAKANRSAATTIERSAREALESHSWPGNVRELRNAIERAVVIAQDHVITTEDLPERVRRGQSDTIPPPVAADGSLDIKERLRQYEAQLLLHALKANDWNQTQTAEALNMPLRTLVHKIRQHGLKKRYDT
jgi:two-component system response regulator AtoC